MVLLLSEISILSKLLLNWPHVTWKELLLDLIAPLIMHQNTKYTGASLKICNGALLHISTSYDHSVKLFSQDNFSTNV